MSTRRRLSGTRGVATGMGCTPRCAAIGWRGQLAAVARGMIYSAYEIRQKRPSKYLGKGVPCPPGLGLNCLHPGPKPPPGTNRSDSKGERGGVRGARSEERPAACDARRETCDRRRAAGDGRWAAGDGRRMNYEGRATGGDGDARQAVSSTAQAAGDNAADFQLLMCQCNPSPERRALR